MKKRILFILLVCLFLMGCGNEKNISSDKIEFNVDAESLLQNGYEEIAGLAYCKLDYSSEKPLCYIQYESNYPQSAFYLMGSLTKELNYGCDFVIVWDGKEYIFDDAMEENYEEAFPAEWKDTIEKSQDIGIDNLVTKAVADTIDESVERFCEKNRKVEETQEKGDKLKGESEQEAEKEDINIIAQKEFLVDNQKLLLGITESEGNISITAYGCANTEEKASLMLVALYSQLEELNTDYSITIQYEDLYAVYIKTGESIYKTGTNKDGSGTMSMPDWIVSEFTMSEEDMESYVAEILTVVKEFEKETGK